MSAWLIDAWDSAVVRGGEGAAREDVCRGEGGGCADAVEEEDLVRGRYEQDASTELELEMEDGQGEDTLSWGAVLEALLAAS